MWDVHDPLVELEITSLVCATVAVLTTLFRLLNRRGRYWWDDLMSTISMLALFIQVAAVFVHAERADSLPQLTKIAAYYMLATTFYTIIWFARLSILFSVIRIAPEEKMRRRLYMVAAVFFTTYMVLFAQLFWVCEPHPAWKKKLVPQCPLNRQVVIFQLVSDVLSDSLLLLAPLRILLGLRNGALRRRLMFIFSTSIITTVVSLVHAVYILRTGGTKVVIAAIVEDCVSLIVCNLPVVATATFRLRSGGETDVSPNPDTSPESRLRFHSRMKSARSQQRTTTFTLSELGQTTVVTPTDSVERFDKPKGPSSLHEPSIDHGACDDPELGNYTRYQARAR